MEIERNVYLQKLIDRKNNGLIKVITGLRRSGKSYLLRKIYKSYLIGQGIPEESILCFAFDNLEDVMKLDAYIKEEPTLIYDAKKNYVVNPKKFILYIQDLAKGDRPYYLLLDEIQLLDSFTMVLNGFLSHENYDVYVTGSNSKMLSKDIVTEFRGRGDQIHVYPLSFKEFFAAANLSYEAAYFEYQHYGGMPFVLSLNSEERKQEYLKRLFSEIYIKDITERKDVRDVDSFSKLLSVLTSAIGSYTNPTKLENSFKSVEKIAYGHMAIRNHIEFIKDAFLLTEANRYDIKRREYIGSNSKFYFTDMGLRNALLNFRQFEPTHLMENIIYNELLIRGYSVDVGIVEIQKKNEKGNVVSKQLETNFVCNRSGERLYIQSAYSMDTLQKQDQEKRPLLHIRDSFRKIIVVNDLVKGYFMDSGIEVISLRDFLLQG